MDSVVSMIRSVLTSTQGSLDVGSLRRDYKMLMGEEIPFRRLGFGRLEDFLQGCPGLSVKRGANGEVFVDAVVTEKSAHIASLVGRQKSAPKRKTKSSVRRCAQQRYNKQTNWRPAASGKKWQPSYIGSPRPAAVAHNQIVNHSPPKRTNNQKSNNRPSTLTSPRTRAAVHRGSSEDISTEPSKTPSPPSTISKDADKGHTARLRRVFSMPDSGTSALQRTVTNHEAAIRPRMRTQTTTSPQPAFTAPNMSAPIQFSTPRVMTSQEEEQLRREGIAAWNSNTSVCNSTHSDDSIQKEQKYMYDNVTYKELVDYARAKLLTEPNVIYTTRKDKSSRTMLYHCKIKVDGEDFSSYPIDHTSLDSALSTVSKNALEKLRQKYDKTNHLLLSTEKDILERIPPIIARHYHGVWAEQIELDYIDLYNEQLPPNWLNLLDTLLTISVDCTEGLEGIEKKFVLRNCKLGEKRGNSAPLAFDVSVPSNTIQVTDEGCSVEVTCVISTVEVWLREVDTEESEKYEKLCNEMEEFYNRNRGVRCTHVNCSGFYVVYYEKVWCRVRAIEVCEDSVLCFFIDFGDEQWIPYDDIYKLERQFARQQAQVFVCRLAGLEELDVPCSLNHLEQIVSKSYVAKPIKTTDSDELENIFSVVLYDSDGDKTVNVNQNLMKTIVVDAAVSSLDEHNINKVYITHANPDGVFFVQPHCDGYHKFNDLMEELQKIDLSTEVPNMALSPKDLTVSNKLFLTKWSKDGRYYRCVIESIQPEKVYAMIFFVDYGNTEIIKLENSILYPLEFISDILFVCPYLSIRVRIDIEKKQLPRNFGEKLMDVWGNNETVLLKVLRTEQNEDGRKEYYCDLFKRSADNILTSAISSLELEKKISNDITDDTLNNNDDDKSKKLSKKLQRLKTVDDLGKPVPSTGLLKAPDLPKTGEWYDVKVPCAVNPWNFFIQPYSSAAKLNELMNSLQERFRVVTHSPITLDDVVPGRIYASKHEDGIWYRTSVIKVINTGSISVFYCDFGYYANLKIYQLIPLGEEYTELPFQAIKAKLDGIKPKNNKWTMDDCKFFEKLVCKKTFVSSICSKQNDELYKYDMVLSLKLVDTTSNKDIQIDKLLIESGIAIPDK